MSEFIKHVGNVSPVSMRSRVVYRTTNAEVAVSHVHMSACAGDLDWSDKPSVGRIYDYKVVD